MNPPFELARRIQSFKHAGRGVWLVFGTQHNAWIHALVTALIIPAGFYVSLSRGEWCLVVLAGAAVWTAEVFNTALEFLADALMPGFNPTVGRAKDVAAGAVLVSAAGAALVGVLVFAPHVLRLVAAH